MEGNSRRLVFALGGALGISLLVIAFLLGRVSGERSQAVPLAQAAPTFPIAAEPPMAPPAGGAPVESLVPFDDGAFPPAEERASFPTGPTWAPPATSPVPGLGDPNGPAPVFSPSADQQAIRAYFSEVDRVDDVGAGDPQAFAASMLQSVSSGDFSGFDDLLAKARGQQERLRRIAPPPACADHHRLAVDLSAQSVAMLGRIKAALMAGDSAALLGIATEGQALEAQANRLQSLGESIRRTAGL